MLLWCSLIIEEASGIIRWQVDYHSEYLINVVLTGLFQQFTSHLVPKQMNGLWQVAFHVQVCLQLVFQWLEFEHLRKKYVIGFSFIAYCNLHNVAIFIMYCLCAIVCSLLTFTWISLVPVECGQLWTWYCFLGTCMYKPCFHICWLYWSLRNRGFKNLYSLSGVWNSHPFHCVTCQFSVALQILVSRCYVRTTDCPYTAGL